MFLEGLINIQIMDAIGFMPEGTQEVQMGVKVSQYPIEKYKATATNIDLITVLTQNPIVTRTMYHDKVGFRFHELNSALRVGLQTNIHYNFLIAIWNSDKAGRTIIDANYTMAVLSLSDRNYSRLIKKFELNGDLRQLVMQITAEDEKFQSMTFEVDSSKKPPFMMSAQLFEMIKADIANFTPFIPLIVGGMLKDEGFMELWNKEGTAVEQGKHDSNFQGRGTVMTGQGQPQMGYGQVQQGFGGNQQQISQGFGGTQQGFGGGAPMNFAPKQESFDFTEKHPGASDAVIIPPQQQHPIQQSPINPNPQQPVQQFGQGQPVQQMSFEGKPPVQQQMTFDGAPNQQGMQQPVQQGAIQQGQVADYSKTFAQGGDFKFD